MVEEFHRVGEGSNGLFQFFQVSYDNFTFFNGSGDFFGDFGQQNESGELGCGVAFLEVQNSLNLSYLTW
jgi:hypothetical protein